LPLRILRHRKNPKGVKVGNVIIPENASTGKNAAWEEWTTDKTASRFYLGSLWLRHKLQGFIETVL